MGTPGDDYGSEAAANNPSETQLRSALIGATITNLSIERGNPALGQNDGLRLSVRQASGTIVTVLLPHATEIRDAGSVVNVRRRGNVG